MSSSWLLKTRQMSEAGKEIILTEALATHMRSPRDRQLVMGSFTEKHPLEDLISYFGAFYLYHYQGVKLLQIDASKEVTIEEVAASEKKERELLEMEVRMLLGEKQREEIDTAKISSEFMVDACNLLEGKVRPDDESVNAIIDLLKKHVQMIPLDYSNNNEIDFLNEITGNGIKWRNEFYSKASGLKESSLSLREELLKSHDEEIIEMSVFKNGIQNTIGDIRLLEKRVLTDEFPEDNWIRISNSIIERILDSDSNASAIKMAYEIRIAALDVLEQELETPTTLEEYETTMGQVLVEEIGRLGEANPRLIFEVLGYLSGIPVSDVISTFRLNRITDSADIVSGLKVSLAESQLEGDAIEAPSYSKEELEEMTRSLKFLEKIEYTLEKPVKGMLKAKGFGGMDLEKISIEFLLKDRSKLLAMEEKVLDELKEKKLRIPSPEEMERLLKLREEFKSGALTGSEVATSAEIRGQLEHGKSMESLKLDLVWYFTIGVLKNLARVVETYIRSKKDIQRAKTLLKSIYEDAEAQLQFLREEILIDLFSMRLYEMKVIHPELDATAVCSWFHARLTNKDLDTAKAAFAKSASPVFEGVSDASLNLSALTFDNYAIAFDLMQRFLVKQRTERDIRIEVDSQVKEAREKVKEAKLASLDVLNFVYTKAHTVFRAIGRVGARGLEWSANDDAKCANLLAFFLQQNRSKPICGVCGEIVQDKKCKKHGKGHVNDANDIDSLAWFVMRSFTDIKEGLLGGTAEPMAWDKARSIVQREISNLRRRGKITSKTNLKAMLPGEINYIVGPVIAGVIGKYFNESLEYAARRAGIA